jgi:NAD(P)-dependent dehydrogenase (short-subunit alcohol dehydrogenase family)
MKKVLITGANKGIGFESAKQLLEKGYFVYLSTRDTEKGKTAVDNLKSISKNISFVEMDVASEESIIAAANYLKSVNIKLDVLINNAGILIDKVSITNLDSETMQKTFVTNTIGPLLIIKYFNSLLNLDGRIVNVSSGLGSLKNMSNNSPAYSISKTALNAVTKQFASALAEKKISVNSVCPGWVKTDMGGNNATRSVEKGSETIVWLATEAPKNLTGKFFRDKKEVDW